MGVLVFIIIILYAIIMLILFIVLSFKCIYSFWQSKSSLTHRRLWKHMNRRRLTGLIKIYYRNDIDKVCWLDSMSVVLQLAGYRVSIADWPAGACWWHKHASRQTAWGSDTEYQWGPASVPSCSQMTQKPLFLSHSCKTTKSYLVQLQPNNLYS